MAHLDYFRWCSMLYVFAAVHTLHGEMYFEHEKEGNIRRRCRPDLQSCFPSQLEWAELDEKLTGKLVWPDDSLNYTAYNNQYNIRTHTYPLVHVVCKTVQDIQKAVRFAKTHNLRVTIKSSGSELWGRSSAHRSFSINLMEMKHIDVNTAATDRSEHGEVTVETGVNFGEIYKAVENHDRIVAGPRGTGTVPGGYIAGGGYGPMSPFLGLAVDNVLEIKVVLADGRVATCTQNKTIIDNNGTSETRNNGELFWALRGGGGGTFGVVVHYVLKLHPAPTSIVTAHITISVYQNDTDRPVVKMFLEAYDEWVRNAPSYWGTSLVVLNTGRFMASLTKLSPWDGNTESELKPFYDLKTLYPQPSMININLANHSSFGASLGPSAPYINGYTGGALIPPEKHNGSLWDFLVHEIMDDRNQHNWYFLIRLGGKILEFNEASSSVHAGYRRAQSYLSGFFAAPLDHAISSFELLERQENNVAQFTDKLLTFLDGDHLNIGYTASPDWKLDFWGAHYVDLLIVKIKYDPDNLFSCYHCVGSDRTDFDDMFKSSGANVTEHFPTFLLLLIAIIIYHIRPY